VKEKNMIDLLQKAHLLGKRLAEAGREARSASVAVTGELMDQLTQAVGAAAGEVVRAAVIGAVAAVMRPSRKPAKQFPPTEYDPWDDVEGLPAVETDDEVHLQQRSAEAQTTPGLASGWAKATRAAGSALTVAAGAAAAVPGGRLVAAGLGAVAAVATLAARASEKTSS